MRGKASCFGKQQHKMVRRHPGNLSHGHQANVCAGVRVDVVDDSGYSTLANLRILSLLLINVCEKTIPENIGQMFRLWSVLPNKWSKKPPTANGGMILLLVSLSGGSAMDMSGVLPVKAVEVMRNGCGVCPIPALSSLHSKRAGWDGIALESFSDVPGVSIPDHDHPTHFLNLLTHGNIRAQWTSEGKSRSADNGPGTIYLLPAGTRDRLTWSGPTTRIILVIEPRFLSRSLEDTAHLDDVELTTHWNLHDRHIQSMMLALHADLEDGSPAGPLYGESLGLALSTYLVRRYSVRNSATPDCRGSMPTMRLNRTLEFINQNLARDLRLWELAQVAGMSPNYFCELFKASTGLPPYQYILRCRIERAKQYLRDPKITLACAAEAVGFADQSHFTKVFRRIVGVTPTRFRGKVGRGHDHA
jgi:AraC family transcriptional regulator